MKSIKRRFRLVTQSAYSASSARERIVQDKRAAMRGLSGEKGLQVFFKASPVITLTRRGAPL